jgi:CubicO group peptidase (beta-lactamase class C family)
VVATAPRGNGPDRNTNIKSCSKSIVALLLGTAIEKGEIADIRASLQSVAPDIIPADTTEGVADITIEDLVTLRAGSKARQDRTMATGSVPGMGRRQSIRDRPSSSGALPFRRRCHIYHRIGEEVALVTHWGTMSGRQ